MVTETTESSNTTLIAVIAGIGVLLIGSVLFATVMCVRKRRNLGMRDDEIVDTEAEEMH